MMCQDSWKIKCFFACFICYPPSATTPPLFGLDTSFSFQVAWFLCSDEFLDGVPVVQSPRTTSSILVTGFVGKDTAGQKSSGDSNEEAG